jgi:hypothetical protein
VHCSLTGRTCRAIHQKHGLGNLAGCLPASQQYQSRPIPRPYTLKWTRTPTRRTVHPALTGGSTCQSYQVDGRAHSAGDIRAIGIIIRMLPLMVPDCTCFVAGLPATYLCAGRGSIGCRHPREGSGRGWGGRGRQRCWRCCWRRHSRCPWGSNHSSGSGSSSCSGWQRRGRRCSLRGMSRMSYCLRLGFAWGFAVRLKGCHGKM